MDFEYDPLKSELNKTKHGIDFEEAKAIWADDLAIHLNIVNTAPDDEERFLVVGMIDQTVWTAVVTYRGERTRMISVRRSRKNEKQAYDYSKGVR